MDLVIMQDTQIGGVTDITLSWRHEFRQMAKSNGVPSHLAPVAEKLTFYFLACQSGSIKKTLVSMISEYLARKDNATLHNNLVDLLTMLEEKEKEL